MRGKATRVNLSIPHAATSQYSNGLIEFLQPEFGQSLGEFRVAAR